MSVKISIDQLGSAIERELTLYSNNVINKIKKEVNKSMTQLVKETKATAPVGNRSKHYRDSISQTKVSEDSRSLVKAWYVTGSNYRLSHLLEHGHATRNGGRVAGYGFIAAAANPILESYIKAVEEIIKNG